MGCFIISHSFLDFVWALEDRCFSEKCSRGQTGILQFY
jgi:hypothetical protein